MDKRKRGAIALSFLAVCILLFLISLSAVYGSVSAGNQSSSLQEKYSAGEAIKGWVNFSVTNEDFNSVVSAFGQSVLLKDLLQRSGLRVNVNYDCTTDACNMTYSSSDSGATSGEYVLNNGGTKLIGLKITSDYVEYITSFKLNFTSNTTKSCSSQLKVDIGDDGSYEWYATQPAITYCSLENYGCYTSSINKIGMTLEENYCETMNVTSTSGLLLGAFVEGSGSGSFTFSARGYTCSVNTTSSGEITCPINISIGDTEEIDVCVKRTAGNYSIFYESTPPVCGYRGGTNYDFSIFSKSLEHDTIGNVIANSSTSSGISFAEIIDSDIIDKMYSERDCSKGCYIPIRITSMQNAQKITLNGASLDYETDIGSANTNKIYSLTSAPSKITMGYTKIWLNNSGFTAPLIAGVKNMTLKLGSRTILYQSIEVLDIPVIRAIYPSNAPAALDTQFTVIADGTNITNYKWVFGDNTTLETSVPYVTHAYPNVGQYTLNVTLTNSAGSSSKVFPINVTSPSAYINSTIAEYKSRINKTKTQINTFPPFVKNYLDNLFNITALEIRLQGLQVAYNSAGNSSQKTIEIATELSAMEMPPYPINVTKRSSGDFIFDKSAVGLVNLAALSGENTTAPASSVQDAVFAWFMENLDVNANLTVYSSYTGNLSNPLLTYVQLKASPVNPIGRFFLIVNEPRDNLEFGTGSAVTSLNNAAGITSDMSSGQKTFEVIFKNRDIALLDMPIYFAPPFSSLTLISGIGVCNNNGRCEKSLNEDYRNCSSDCKPWGKAIFWIIVVLIFVFILYILAQEWYKRKYESYLFKDKNDLYNLVNFIDNAEKQAMNREEIFQRLKDKGWHHEQIVYAYKKYKGERTGMWEIPIFRFSEKKKTSEELQLRNKIGMNPSIAPRPIRPFVPKQPSIKPPFSSQKPPITASKPPVAGQQQVKDTKTAEKKQ